MIAYQKRQLPSDDIGEPGDLPAELVGLEDSNPVTNKPGFGMATVIFIGI